MRHATRTVARWFPLVGRPRPACPALPVRIQEIADAVNTAEQQPERGLADAAHALNKAALVVSDCGMPYLAEELCWRHINAYRLVDRPLTVLEARYMLEPVLNLVRLKIRAEQGNAAVRLLEAMYQAVTRRQDLTVSGNALPTANLVGEQPERRQLREWTWLQLVSEGVRALALANRWSDAAEHAGTHNGIGRHLMEGRQADIVAACLHGDLPRARTLLAQATPTQPWELEVVACLRLMCARPDDPTYGDHVSTALARLRARSPMPGYASYRIRLGLAVATLSAEVCTPVAAEVLGQLTQEVIASADGYAARDLLGCGEPFGGITDRQRANLVGLAQAAGLGLGAMPDQIRRRLDAATTKAEAILEGALATPSR